MDKKYYGKIDLNVENNSHTQAFFFLREHITSNRIAHPRVLEAGCSGGYFSEVLKDHGIHVTGIEPFSTEAADADRVTVFYHSTIEEFCAVEHSELEHSFDAIIFGDVLEHLVSPEDTLRALSLYLKGNGVFIASIPDITHIGVRKMLEDGIWKYQKYGILDSTHRHFFSWTTIKTLFLEVGFGIVRHYNVLVSEFDVYPSIDALQATLDRTPLTPEDHTFQHVVMASHEAFRRITHMDMKPKHILVVSPNPHSTLTEIRLLLPLGEYVKKYGGEVKAINCNNFREDMLDWADIVIPHREISTVGFEFLKIAKKREIPIVYDIDDLLTELPQESLQIVTPAMSTLMKSSMWLADKITCTTSILRTQLEKISDNVTVIPNICIPVEKISPAKDRQYDGPCTLVIASSDTMLNAFIYPVIHVLMKKIKGLKLVAIGNIASKFTGMKNAELHGLCSEHQFQKILHNVQNGIGLIPLQEGLFFSCKSPIKVWHYSVCGIVSVASDVSPYSGVIDNGKSGVLVENSPDAWCAAVIDLILHPEKRQRMLTDCVRRWHATASSETAVTAWDKTIRCLARRPSRQSEIKTISRGKVRKIALMQAAAVTLEGAADFVFPYTLATLSAWIKHTSPGTEVVLAVKPQEALTADEVWCTSLSEDWGNAICLGRYFTEHGVKFLVGGHHATALPETMPYGQVFRGPVEQVKNIDDLPLPDWSLFGEPQKKMGVLMTSRGCPFSCNFCSSKAFWKGYQCKSPEKVLTEIRQLADMGMNKIIIFDDLFTVDRKRLAKIAEMIVAEGLNGINYSCLVRSDTVNIEILSILRKMNVNDVAFGSESGDDNILRAMNKNNTVAHNLRAVSLLHVMGYTPNTSLVIGYPGENRASLKRTCDYIENIRKYTGVIDIYPVIPYPGTPLWNIFREKYNPDLTNFDWTSLALRSNAVSWDKYHLLSDECTVNDLRSAAEWNARHYTI